MFGKTMYVKQISDDYQLQNLLLSSIFDRTNSSVQMSNV